MLKSTLAKIDKKEVLDALIQGIETELQTAINAAKTAEMDATNEESRPENEYDTRALESSYVAAGQVQRVSDLRETLFQVKHLQLKDFAENDPIVATALIEAISEGKSQVLFFAPLGGGIHFTISGVRIQVVTPSTPLGQALVQAKKGDIVSIVAGSKEREFEILDIK